MTELVNQPGRIRLSHAYAEIKIYPDTPPPHGGGILLDDCDKMKSKRSKLDQNEVNRSSKRPKPSTSQSESDCPMPKLKLKYIHDPPHGGVILIGDFLQNSQNGQN